MHEETMLKAHYACYMTASHHHPPISMQMKRRAREFRREQTDAEKTMWRLLRDRQLDGAKFRRQHVIENYIIDFYCHEAKLAIELDGGQHAEPAQQAHDDERTRVLKEQGIHVMRFWNNEVLKNPQGVLLVIGEALEARIA